MSCTMYFIPYDSRLTTYGQWKMAAYWLEECVWSPHGKGSSHSKAERGRHPDQELVASAVGANYGWKKELQSS